MNSMSSIRAIALAKAIGGGGSDVEVEALSVSQNGTTTAPEGKAYNPVTVDVQPPLQQKSVSVNGDVTPDTGYYGLSKVTVDVPTGGGGGVAASDVNFYDYDGTIVAAYTAAAFANLEALPANPDHTADGLTAQGWNWTLSDAKTYVAAYGALEIGQTYITTDGKTHIHIHLEPGRTSPMLGVCPNGTVDVDWGDGTAHDTLTGSSVTSVQWTPTHNYPAQGGDFVIKLGVSEGGSMGFYGSSSSNQYSALLRYSSSGDARNRVYQNSIKAVFIGNGVTSIGGYAFQSCYSLSSITIPDSVTSIGGYAFQGCYKLSSITIPDSVTSIGGNAFQNGYRLSSITIPDSVTSIGTYAFSACYKLSSITIPDSVTSIGSYAFMNCYGLSSITIPDSVTSIENNTFQGCSSLSSITISDGLTSIGNTAFQYCSSLSNITIPDSVTSIGSSSFAYCYGLSSITIPDRVTSIGDSAFQNCSGMSEVHIKPTNPPTLGTNVFANIPADCIFYVPAASVETYKTASGWSTYASQIQAEPA